jgi:hypothetical protein
MTASITHPPSTTAPRTMSRTATRSRSRLTRLHLVLIALVAVFTWLALTVVVATRKGEHRRATFNNSARVYR